MMRNRVGSWLLVATALALLGTRPAAGESTDAVGDVTVIGTATPDVACPECPEGNKGVEMSYEVQMASNSENQGAQDFHIRVTDQASENYRCMRVERWDPLAQPPGWVTDSWTGTLVNSQVENGVNVHYIGWYRVSGNLIRQGDRFRFIVVYCGKAKRDSSIEWILTNDGTQAPAVPDVSGDRSDVPDGPSGHDDPGWIGPTNSNPGSGFALIAGDAPGLSTTGIVALVVLMGLLGGWWLKRTAA